MEKYQWAIKVTTEYLNGAGDVEQTVTDIRQEKDERAARSRHESIQDMLKRPGRNHPKYQRIAKSELLRRPVGDWEVTA